MKCPRCSAAYSGKVFTAGGVPRCAFPEGAEFQADNWNCATMNDLRNLVEGRTVYSEDQNAALWPVDGDFLVLGWYKSRGCTELAAVLSGQKMMPLRLDFAEEVLGTESAPEAEEPK